MPKVIFDSEPLWCKWKEEKAPGFEKQASRVVRERLTAERKRDVKAKEKQAKAGLLVKAEQFNQHKGAANLHKYLRAPIDFSLLSDGRADMASY